MTIWEEQPARFTAEQFMELVQSTPIGDWFGRVELVKGVITRMSPAQIPHWHAQRRVFLKLYEALRDSAPDWIVGQEPSVRLAGDTVREPDVVILRNAGLGGQIFDRSALFLAVEIADSSVSNDLNAKKRDYAQAFIPHYWVVDINAQSVHVMAEPAEGTYHRYATVRFGDPLLIPETEIVIILG